jgi:aminopeptidase N
MTERVTLPTDVLPHHYSLELTPNLEKLDFYCDEVIDVTVLNEVTEVTLHSKEIFIETVTFSSTGSATSPSVVGISYNVKYHTVKFTFDGALPLGAGKLTLHYRGILNGDMAGFYKSTYADANGNKKIMASTQFEALDARRYVACLVSNIVSRTAELSFIRQLQCLPVLG